jgi:lipopolysaccharide export system protein LptA
MLEGASQQVDGFTLSSIDGDGASSWQLKGSWADIKDDRVELKGVRVESKTADTRVTMKADKGTIKKNEDVGIFKENVVLAYEDGTTLTTDAVKWSFKDQIATAGGKVFVKSGDLMTRAKGALLKKGVNEITLNKDISMKTSSGTKIKCAGPLIMDYKKNMAIFNNDVSIENPKGKMIGRRMIVFFDPDKKAVKKVEAFGGVCLFRGNSISLSDRATYFSEEGRAVLTGNPTVYVDSEETRLMAKAKEGLSR